MGIRNENSTDNAQKLLIKFFFLTRKKSARDARGKSYFLIKRGN